MGEDKRRREFYQQKPNERLGDAPVEEQYYEHMKEVGKTLDIMFNGPAEGPDRKVGFILMVFPFGDHQGRCNYLSNGADREDVVLLMREMITRFERARSG